jgi:hypothetical protein
MCCCCCYRDEFFRQYCKEQSAEELYEQIDQLNKNLVRAGHGNAAMCLVASAVKGAIGSRPPQQRGATCSTRHCAMHNARCCALFCALIAAALQPAHAPLDSTSCCSTLLPFACNLPYCETLNLQLSCTPQFGCSCVCFAPVYLVTCNMSSACFPVLGTLWSCSC